MLKYLLTIILLPIVLQSQSIVWEISQPVNIGSFTDNYSFLIDSKGNPLVVVDGYSSPDTIKSSFIKFDTIGNVLSYKQYISSNRRYPVSFSETAHGYRLFCLADSNKKGTPYLASLPIIIDTDINGDSISSIQKYELQEPENYNEFGTKINPLKTQSFSAKQIFYNAYIEEKVDIGDDKYSPLHHLIISAYDTNGKFLWRKGYDTLKGSLDIYILRNIKLSKSNTILAVIQLSERRSGKYVHRSKIIEIDLEGNFQRAITYAPDESSVLPADVVKLEDGSYIILGKNADAGLKNNFLVKLNSNGQVVRKYDIPLGGINDNLTGLSISQSGAFVVYGTSITDENDPKNAYDDLYQLYIAKTSSNFDLEWNYLWHEHAMGSGSTIKNIEFLDENNIIAIGCKNMFNIFCAKISLLPTSVKEGISQREYFSLYPNPASDYITINCGSIGACSNDIWASPNATVQIFDMLGLEVAQTPSSVNNMKNTQTGASELLRMDVSHLPAGVYFVKIVGCNGECSIVEKFLKM